LLGGDPNNVLMLAGVMMLVAAAATMMVRAHQPSAGSRVRT
jgi:hypothetical protein